MEDKDLFEEREICGKKEKKMESGRWAGRVIIEKGNRERGGVESGGKKIDGNLRSFIKLDVEAHSYHKGCLYQRGLISLKACLILRWECVCVCAVEG